MTFVIVKDGEIKFGPKSWNAGSFSQELRKYGQNVSLQVAAPAAPIGFADALFIAPVEYQAVSVPDGKRSNGYTMSVSVAGVVTAEPVYVDLTPEELNPTPSAATLRRNELENAYLAATSQLVQLATGTAPALGTKLEDVEYQQMAQAAAVNDSVATMLLLSTLQYTFFQIKLLNLAWEDITWHEE